VDEHGCRIPSTLLEVDPFVIRIAVETQTRTPIVPGDRERICLTCGRLQPAPPYSKIRLDIRRVTVQSNQTVYVPYLNRSSRQ
jgi:hypothetical protein